MTRIESPKTVVIHDGVDVSVSDGIITIKPTIPGQGFYGPLSFGQVQGQAQQGQIGIVSTNPNMPTHSIYMHNGKKDF